MSARALPRVVVGVLTAVAGVTGVRLLLRRGNTRVVRVRP